MDAQHVRAVADAFVAGFFDRFPERATFQGYGGADDGRFGDNSQAAIRAWERRLEGWSAEIEPVESESLADATESPLFSLLEEVLEGSRDLAVCRFELWDVSPTYTGWQSWMALLASVQPVGDPRARAKTIERFGSIPRYLENQRANLEQGIRLGYAAPRTSVESVIAQLDALLATEPDETPFFDPARRDSAPAFRRDLRRLIVDVIQPSVREYRDFLQSEYLSTARETVAVAANPDGVACYAASLRFYTSLEDLQPAQVHRLGTSELERIEGEMRDIAVRAFQTSDVRGLLERLRTDPTFTFGTRAEMIHYATAAVERARAAVPRWVGMVPEASVVIQPFPAFQERAAPGGQYLAASDDGSRPAVYLINTHAPRTQSRAGLESTAFHETYPGHHLQIAIAKERPEAHPLTRYFGPSGFSEGWGLYAEELADEMGLFSSDVDRMGMLSNQSLRAVRLVVDSGIHALGWSRERAIDYMLEHTTLARAGATAEVDRYIAVPGQATAYMIGYLELRRLRQLAERELGDSFDIREFHDRILEDGRVPLPFLRRKIECWIEATAR